LTLTVVPTAQEVLHGTVALHSIAQTICSVTDISTLTEHLMQQAVMLSTISRGSAMSFAIEPLSKLASRI
jgi:hypothetical protein